MRLLLDSHFHSVLYYNASIWLTPGIGHDMKQNILSISANAQRTCLKHDGHDISFESLHKIHETFTPKQIVMYQIALSLQKTVSILVSVVRCLSTLVNESLLK